MPWHKLGPKVTLTVMGFMQAAGSSVKSTTKTIVKFDWSNALCDAGILAGITFFTALSGVKLVEVETTKAVMGASISASLQFLTILALKRKLIKQNSGT